MIIVVLVLCLSKKVKTKEEKNKLNKMLPIAD